jgi:hypothetical protein
LQQGRTLGNKLPAMLGPILVGWADNFNRCHQPPLSGVDSHFVFILVLQVNIHRKRRFRGCPHGRRGASTRCFFSRTQPVRFFPVKSCHVDFEFRAKVHARLGLVN